MVRAPEDLELRLEDHRRELTAYAYRMLGSAFEAEDAVQETMLRAWRGFEAFECRSALRSWLYRIATNVCLDMLADRSRRFRPMEEGEANSPEDPLITRPIHCSPSVPATTSASPVRRSTTPSRVSKGGFPAELA